MRLAQPRSVNLKMMMMMMMPSLSSSPTIGNRNILLQQSSSSPPAAQAQLAAVKARRPYHGSMKQSLREAGPHGAPCQSRRPSRSPSAGSNYVWLRGVSDPLVVPASFCPTHGSVGAEGNM